MVVLVVVVLAVVVAVLVVVVAVLVPVVEVLVEGVVALVVHARQDLQKSHSHVCAHGLVAQDAKHCCSRASVFVVVVTPVVPSTVTVAVGIVVVLANVSEAVTVEMLSTEGCTAVVAIVLRIEDLWAMVSLFMQYSPIKNFQYLVVMHFRNMTLLQRKTHEQTHRTLLMLSTP